MAVRAGKDAELATSLPIPVEFQLPDGWNPAPPDDIGAPEAAFVAVHPPADNGFTANITISGDYRTDEAALGEIADESLRRLEQTSDEVSVAERTDVGSEAAPGLTQLVRLRPLLDGTPRDLVQSQVYLSLLDVDAPQQRVVLQLVLTATPGQLDNTIEDFQRFVATVRPRNNQTADDDNED